MRQIVDFATWWRRAFSNRVSYLTECLDVFFGQLCAKVWGADFHTIENIWDSQGFLLRR
jgi:hypothetical protein